MRFLLHSDAGRHWHDRGHQHDGRTDWRHAGNGRRHRFRYVWHTACTRGDIIMTKKFDDFDLMELEAEFDKLPPELVAEMEAEFEETFADGVAPTTFDEIFGDF